MIKNVYSSLVLYTIRYSNIPWYSATASPSLGIVVNYKKKTVQRATIF